MVVMMILVMVPMVMIVASGDICVGQVMVVIADNGGNDTGDGANGDDSGQW
jgi:hypothetical protein